MGDQWPRLQDFIEHVVDRYRRNPIVIFPQSLYFQDRSRLQRAASILQRHPDLTLVLRDQVSFQFAQNHFSGCHLLLCPDMAFALPIDELFPAGQIGRQSHPRRPWLALCRGDPEASSTPWNAIWHRGAAGWSAPTGCLRSATGFGEIDGFP